MPLIERDRTTGSTEINNPDEPHRYHHTTPNPTLHIDVGPNTDYLALYWLHPKTLAEHSKQLEKDAHLNIHTANKRLVQPKNPPETVPDDIPLSTLDALDSPLHAICSNLVYASTEKPYEIAYENYPDNPDSKTVILLTDPSHCLLSHTLSHYAPSNWNIPELIEDIRTNTTANI